MKKKNERWYYIFLTVLKTLKSEFTLNVELKSILKEDIIASCNSIECKFESIKILDKVRNNIPLDQNDLIFLKLLKQPHNKKQKLQVITKSKEIEHILDSDFYNFLETDESKVLKSYNSGMKFISNISKDWSKMISNNLDILCGINDQYNLINSGFTKDFPGLINFNINGDTIVLAEQLIHETTHLAFENQLFFNKKLSKLLNELPPVFSIFAKKPRKLDLVIHGLFSYTSIYFLYERAYKKKMITNNCYIKRNKSITKYIKNAIYNLNMVFNENNWNYISNIYYKISKIDPIEFWRNFKFKESEKSFQISKFTNYLNQIEIAELILALEGNKVSRISINVKEVPQIIELISELNIYYCFSDYLFSGGSDVENTTFQNKISNVHNLDTVLKSDTQTYIHLYFSNSQKLVIKSFKLDKIDESGTLFKTPKCCQKFFKEKWNFEDSNFDGDLVKYYLNSKHEFDAKFNLYNPIGMYFGFGFCWHFPCSLSCSKTKKTVDDRIKILKKYPKIYSYLAKTKKLHYFYQNGYNYKSN